MLIPIILRIRLEFGAGITRSQNRGLGVYCVSLLGQSTYWIISLGRICPVGKTPFLFSYILTGLALRTPTGEFIV